MFELKRLVALEYGALFYKALLLSPIFSRLKKNFHHVRRVKYKHLEDNISCILQQHEVLTQLGIFHQSLNKTRETDYVTYRVLTKTPFGDELDEIFAFPTVLLG